MRIIIEIDEEARGATGGTGVEVRHELAATAAATADGSDEDVDGGPAPGSEDGDEDIEPAAGPDGVEAAGAAPELGDGEE